MNKKKLQSYLKTFSSAFIITNENDDEFLYCRCCIKKDDLKIPKKLEIKKYITKSLDGFYVKVEDSLSNINAFSYLRQYNSANFFTLLKVDDEVYCVDQECLELFDENAILEISIYNDNPMVRVKEKGEVVGYIPIYPKDFTRAIEVKAYDNKDERVYKFFSKGV